MLKKGVVEDHKTELKDLEASFVAKVDSKMAQIAKIEEGHQKELIELLQTEKLGLYETQRELIQKIDAHREELRVLIE